MSTAGSVLASVEVVDDVVVTRAAPPPLLVLARDVAIGATERLLSRANASRRGTTGHGYRLCRAKGKIVAD
jgi:hypothetical protein